ncbi:MAG: hypothetical protein Q4A40_05920 [Bacillota bacterium]|nr:hypothetical protein [Bacillota bacterium]
MIGQLQLKGMRITRSSSPVEEGKKEGIEVSRNLMITAVIAILVIAAAVYIFTPVGTGRTSLSDEQIDSLCTEFAEETETMGIGGADPAPPATSQAAVKIFGVKDNESCKTIYGYVNYGEFISHGGKAYEVSGGCNAFMIDVKYGGNRTEIVKEYGNGVNSESTYEEMPLRYRLQLSEYDNGRRRLTEELNRKVEQVLGVPVETEYTLSIDGDAYEIYDIDPEGNITTLEKGKARDL